MKNKIVKWFNRLIVELVCGHAVFTIQPFNASTNHFSKK